MAEPRRHGCLTALMILAGVVLLLPGLCVLITAVLALPGLIASVVGSFTGRPPADPYFWAIIGGWAAFWAICIAVSYLGIRLPIHASK